MFQVLEKGNEVLRKEHVLQETSVPHQKKLLKVFSIICYKNKIVLYKKKMLMFFKILNVISNLANIMQLKHNITIIFRFTK